MSFGSQRPPDLDELVAEMAPAERDRLRRTHELLVKAGPPPELSPELEKVPWPDEALQPLGLTRRRERGRPWVLIATAAAALLLVGFLIGQLGGSKKTSFESVFTVKMHGVRAERNAAAVIEVGKVNADGNWPMLVTLTNLRPARNGGYYDLWLSKHGKPLFLCGTFNTRAPSSQTVIRLSAAYPLKKGMFDGWVVTQHVAGTPESHAPVVMTT